MFIRFILEGYLDICICAALNWLFVAGDKDSLRWDSTFYVVNNATLILLTLAVIGFPFWVIIFYCKSFARWQQEDFAEKYGAALEGYDIRHRSIVGYPVIFMARRFALTLVVTLGRQYLFAQIAVMFVFATLQVGFLTTFRPFTEPLLMKLDVFNEFTTVVLVDLLVVLSDANQSKFDFEADIFFLACLFGNLSVHLILLVRNTV